MVHDAYYYYNLMLEHQVPPHSPNLCKCGEFYPCLTYRLADEAYQLVMGMMALRTGNANIWDSASDEVKPLLLSQADIIVGIIGPEPEPESEPEPEPEIDDEDEDDE